MYIIYTFSSGQTGRLPQLHWAMVFRAESSTPPCSSDVHSGHPIAYHQGFTEIFLHGNGQQMVWLVGPLVPDVGGCSPTLSHSLCLNQSSSAGISVGVEFQGNKVDW